VEFDGPSRETGVSWPVVEHVEALNRRPMGAANRGDADPVPWAGWNRPSVEHGECADTVLIPWTVAAKLADSAGRGS
jgi:hypothetical protein